jgi:cytoskeletal protein CcmA (bactofilin family)
MSTPRIQPRVPYARRGGIYFAVIGVSMLVALIGLGAMAAVRAQRLTVTVATNTVEARESSRSALELGALWVAADSAWRSNRPDGAWVTGRSLGSGSIEIQGIDPVDGKIANRPTDPLTIRGVGVKGSSRQMLEATFTASGPPIDALKMAVHTAGQLHVRSGHILTVSGAPASTNGSLRNDYRIEGDVECRGFTSMGIITGSFNALAPIKPMPDAGVVSLYQNLGTTMNAPSTISKRLISPTSNPWGATNAEGVYVITTNSDLTIQDTRIYGTLVILNAGKKVTIYDSVHIQPVRKDYPALIVTGDLVLDGNASVLLSEALVGANLNPPGSPFNGSENLNTTDSYPSEIVGLVHVKGWIDVKDRAKVTGCLIAESSNSDAIDIEEDFTVVYDPALQTTPIMGYMKSVTMTLVPGSYKQYVTP